MSWQSIERAVQNPLVHKHDQPETTEELLEHLKDLAREVNSLHNAAYVLQLAVGGAAGSLAVTLPKAFADANYTPLAIADWNTTVYVTAISASAFTITFGTAAPGGGGVLRCWIIR